MSMHGCSWPENMVFHLSYDPIKTHEPKWHPSYGIRCATNTHHTHADCPCVPQNITRWDNLQASPSKLLPCYRSFGLIDIQKSRYTHHKV